MLRDGRRAATEPPQPTLADIPALVEESRAAGDARDAADRRRATATLPDALGRTAYRIVQEGLTNARKHAPAAARRRRASRPAGRGARGRGRQPRARSARRRRPLPGAGTGLVGLAERVALAGGELRARARTPRGDFVAARRRCRGAR